MIHLVDKDTGNPVGDITEEQFRFLSDTLEEESADDHDYYINRDTIESFVEQNADPDLVETLKRALDDREEMEIVWVRG